MRSRLLVRTDIARQPSFSSEPETRIEAAVDQGQVRRWTATAANRSAKSNSN